MIFFVTLLDIKPVGNSSLQGHEYACYLFDPESQFLMQEYLGPEIISHFVMHGTGVAEIVKHLITVLKKKDADLSNIFLEALKRVSLMTVRLRNFI